MQNQDLFYYKNYCQIFPFHTAKKTLCTSPLGGGIAVDKTAAVNINCLGGRYECEMRGNTYEEDLAAYVRELGLDPAKTVALSTAAWTEQASCVKKTYQELSVTAAATGSIDHNGMRVGDPAGYCEMDGSYTLLPGTINLFLFINQKVTDAAMLRALELCGEAKAAAVQELLLGSCYSEEISTGSGTDGVVIASELQAEHTLTDASGHSKLGELVGLAAKEAVQQALKNLSAASPARQFQVLKRVERFGITVAGLWDFYTDHRELLKQTGVEFENAAAMENMLMQYNQNSNLLLTTSLYAHLMDQLRWGLIMQAEALREGKRLLLTMLHVSGSRYLGDCLEADSECDFPEEYGMKGQLMYYLLRFLHVKMHLYT